MDEFLPLVYIAGPITIPDPISNTHNAVVIADELYSDGICVPLVPHMNLLWHFICPHETEHWYEYDMHVMKRCEAVLRLPGESIGADAEVSQALDWAMPVFHSVEALTVWVTDTRLRNKEDEDFFNRKVFPPTEPLFTDRWWQE